MMNYRIRAEIYFTIEAQGPEDAKYNAEHKIAEEWDELDDYDVISVSEQATELA